MVTIADDGWVRKMIERVEQSQRYRRGVKLRERDVKVERKTGWRKEGRQTESK